MDSSGWCSSMARHFWLWTSNGPGLELKTAQLVGLGWQAGFLGWGGEDAHLHSALTGWRGLRQHLTETWQQAFVLGREEGTTEHCFGWGRSGEAIPMATPRLGMQVVSRPGLSDVSQV